MEPINIRAESRGGSRVCTSTPRVFISRKIHPIILEPLVMARSWPMLMNKLRAVQRMKSAQLLVELWLAVDWVSFENDSRRDGRGSPWIVDRPAAPSQ